MSTELKRPTKNITATRFTGRGPISDKPFTGIQLTAPRKDMNGFHTLQLSRGEALLVAQTLLAFGLGQEEEA